MNMRHLSLFLCMILLVAGRIGIAASKSDEPNRGGSIDMSSVDPKVELSRFKLMDGFKIELFASDLDFPDLQKPLAMTFDARGRMWVTTMPTYPQYLPPNKPNDKILILEDTDGDGKADKCTVFADGLHLPTGIELGFGGVYVGAQPDMVFLKDTTGGDKADYSEIILHGLGSEDSHHAVHAFYWAPDGALLFHEGTFHQSQIETPYGPVRLSNSGAFRFEPRTWKTSVFVSFPFANPWGHVFDKWGQNFLADASGGSNYFASAITGQVNYPDKHNGMKTFINFSVRPTCGCVFVTSRHFPDDMQGNFLFTNNIGFQGVKQYKVKEDGSGFSGNEIQNFLLSEDRNFRPVGIKFGPDGALYIVDWFNPLIGHMQYSLRDERRDHTRGRIWRITYPGRPLVNAPKIAGATNTEVLDVLKEYEDDARYRARRELNSRKREDVLPDLKKWIAGLDVNDKEYEHNLLEGLWIYQTLNVVEPELLNKLLNAKEPRARAAATRALRYWLDRIPDPLGILRKQIQDEFPRVRLEALLTLSFFTGKDGAEAAEIALQALNKPGDYYIDYVLGETLRTLEPYWKPAIASGKPFAADNPKGLEYVLNHITVLELAGAARSKPVYEALLSREGVAVKERREAITALAKLNGSSEFDELAKAIKAAKGGALTDLAEILAKLDASALVKVRDFVQTLVNRPGEAAVRRAGFAALMRADGSAGKAWAFATQENKLADLLDSTSLLDDEKLLSEIYPRAVQIIKERSDANSAKSKGVPARFVRVELPGSKRTLTLAEVEVFSGGKNIARGQKASQSATAYNAPASRAVDGKTDGAFGANTSTHTTEDQPDPWWEVDLGKEQIIESVVIWNRTDEGTSKRLDGFTLLALDEKHQPVFERENVAAPEKNIVIEISGDPMTPVRRAAIDALPRISGHDAESYAVLSVLVFANVESERAIRALTMLKKEAWPKERVEDLAKAIAEHASKAPMPQRDKPEFAAALSLGRYLAGQLGPAGTPILASLKSSEVQIFTIKTVEEQMRYDTRQIFVEAGRPVEIIFENPDVMQHNLIITEPGAMLEIGQAAEAMGASGFQKEYAPANPKVLFKTRLVMPKTTEYLRFDAPATLGDYPFLCTFPGHYIIMNGIMTVVPKDDPKSGTLVKNERAEKLPPIEDLLKISGDAASGKQVFEKTCIICHRIGNFGADFGPNLSQVSLRLKKEKMFQSVLDPSAEIDPKFQTVSLKLNSGQILTGIIGDETDGAIKLKLGGDNVTVVKRSDITKRVVQKTSMMPVGLEQTMTKQQLVDLVEYLSQQK